MHSKKNVLNIINFIKMKIFIGGLHRTSCQTFDFQVSQLKNPPGRISPGEILPGGDCTAARPSRQDLPNPDRGQNHVIFEDVEVKLMWCSPHDEHITPCNDMLIRHDFRFICYLNIFWYAMFAWYVILASCFMLCHVMLASYVLLT